MVFTNTSIKLQPWKLKIPVHHVLEKQGTCWTLLHPCTMFHWKDPVVQPPTNHSEHLCGSALSQTLWMWHKNAYKIHPQIQSSSLWWKEVGSRPLLQDFWRRNPNQPHRRIKEFSSFPTTDHLEKTRLTLSFTSKRKELIARGCSFKSLIIQGRKNGKKELKQPKPLVN